MDITGKETSPHGIGGEDRVRFATSQTNAMLNMLSNYLEAAARGDTETLSESTLALYVNQLEMNLAEIEQGVDEMVEDYNDKPGPGPLKAKAS